MPNPIELREKRAALVAQARQIVDKADTEKRGLTTEEQQQYDRMMADVDTIKADIDREERLASVEKEMAAPAGPSTRNAPGAAPGEVRDAKGVTANPEYRAAFLHLIRNGQLACDPNELRTMKVGSDPDGGFLVPDTLQTQIREKLENENIMRRLVSVMTTSTDQNIPFEDDYGEAFWVGEEKAVNESNVQLSLKNIGSHKLSTLIKVSEELLQDAAFDVEGYIARVFARRYGRKEESAILTGNGIGKPRGITLDATTGVTTAANNAITSDEIIDLYHSLARYFRSNARFIMADSTVKVIRKLKNATTGDYMWQPGLQAGQPDMLLGKAVEVSDDVAAIAASAKVILFGDYREYQLVDRRNAYLQRLSELYAVNGQIGFRGYKRLDGRLLRSDAVKMLVMKA